MRMCTYRDKTYKKTYAQVQCHFSNWIPRTDENICPKVHFKKHATIREKRFINKGKHTSIMRFNRDGYFFSLNDAKSRSFFKCNVQRRGLH